MGNCIVLVALQQNVDPLVGLLGQAYILYILYNNNILYCRRLRQASSPQEEREHLLVILELVGDRAAQPEC